MPPEGDPFLIAAAPERSALVINFHNAVGNQTPYNLTIRVTTQNGLKANATIPVKANITAGELRDVVYAALKNTKGLDVEWTSDDRLIVYGTKNDQLTQIRFDANVQQVNLIRGSTVPTGNITPKLNINGSDQR